MIEIFQNAIFIQVLGFIAFALAVTAFSSKDDIKLKKLLVVESFVLSVHFFLLGAHGGAIASAITGFRNFASLRSKLRILGVIFAILYIALGAFAYDGWIDALPVIGSVMSTVGLFYLKKIPMRLCALFSTTLWIIHNLMVGSIGPLFMEIFIFAANLRTIISLKKADTGNNLPPLE